MKFQLNIPKVSVMFYENMDTQTYGPQEITFTHASIDRETWILSLCMMQCSKNS